MFAETNFFEQIQYICIIFIDVFTPCNIQMSKIFRKSCDIVSNPSFCTFTQHEALHSVALLSSGMKTEPDVVNVSSTSWLLHSSNYKEATGFCENNLKGKLKIFNTHLSNDRDSISLLFTWMEREQKLWNGYRLTSPWLQNMGEIPKELCK